MAQHGSVTTNLPKCISWVSTSRLDFFHIPNYSVGYQMVDTIGPTVNLVSTYQIQGTAPESEKIIKINIVKAFKECTIKGETGIGTEE